MQRSTSPATAGQYSGQDRAQTDTSSNEIYAIFHYQCSFPKLNCIQLRNCIGSRIVRGNLDPVNKSMPNLWRYLVVTVLYSFIRLWRACTLKGMLIAKRAGSYETTNLNFGGATDAPGVEHSNTDLGTINLKDIRYCNLNLAISWAPHCATADEDTIKPELYKPMKDFLATTGLSPR